uniref:CAP, isoform AC n=3 Tax=Drosophila melanogaster TaxID=7227 RepID=A0A6M3QH40_DROME|nr:CAP, isoform AC [Drosophila melanogaster]QJC18698.1 CAP, isoform AC [Drosophila melanogaster]
MPNNRNRNRNRNRNKRNRNQNQNQNPSQNQNENHQQQAEGAEDREEQQDFQTQIAVAQSSSFVDDNGNSGSVSNGPTENSEEVTNTLEKTEKKEEIFEQPATVIQKEADSDAEMGAKNSKHRKEKSDKQASNGKSEEQVRPPPTIIRRPPGSPRQAKVIVHRIVREEDTANGKAQSPEPPKAVESKEQHMEVEDSKKEKPEAQQEIETKEERENEPSPKELPESSHLSEDAQQKHVEVEENQQVYDEVDYSKDETTDNNPQQEQHDSKEPEQYVLQLEKAMEFVENAHQQHVAAVQSYQKQRDTEQNAQQQEQNEAQHLQESTKAHQQNIAVPQILVDPKKREEGLAQQLHHDVKEEPILNNAQQQNDDTAPKSPKEVTIKVQFQTEDPYSQQPPPQKPTSKVIIHQIHVETTDEEQNAKPTFEEVSSTTGSLAGTLSPPPRYLVESPKNVSSGQFSNFSRNVQIQEMELNSDFSSGEFNSLQSPLVCEVDSESEGSVVLGPERSPSDQQVPSSSRVEQHEQVRQKRAQYRNALESHFMPQLLNPRYLDSILEENEWRNSTASSGGSDQTGIRTPKLNETFPRSQLDFSRRHKRREEAPSPLKLETKLLEESTDLESCTRLQSALSPQSEDAELVYLSSSASSSVSDLMELELEQAAALAERALVDLDTDASRLIARPDDEMSSTSTTTADRSETEAETETETEREGEQSRESTPVNANPTLASSQSSLLSAATPTPTPTPTPADREQLAKDTNVSGGSTVSFGAASPLAATREEFVRNMDKVRELIEMTRREQEQGELPRSPSPPPVPPPPASVPPYSPESSSFHLASLQLKRQESNDSHCSDSTTHSQCTAINLASPPPPPTAQPPTPPLRQKPAPPPVPQPVSPPAPPTPQSEPELSVADSVANANADVDADADTDTEAIKKLRLLCTEQLASMPYGEQVLEELASVAQNISDQSQNKMPYPMPQLPHIKELQLNANESKSSSAWLGLPTQSDPKLLVCLSPGQRDLVNNQTQPDDLLDAHQKFVERRGYHELSKAQVLEQDHQQQQSEMLKTAAMMRELRKSLSPPAPPVPPPPVPVKSAETAAKATAHENAKRDDASEQKQKIAACESSSLENKPRRAADLGAQQSAEQRQSSSTTTSSHKATTETMSSDTAKFPTLDSMESELARMFPQHKGDIFEEQRKRFSNIEFPSHQPVSQTKRYSNIETSSYESKKRMENGQVVYDVSTSSHEKKEQGDPPKDQPVPPVPPPPIMSATKLNGNTFIDGDVAPKNSQPSRESGSGSGNGTYEEFRQRAKAAADAFGEQREQQNGLDQDRVFKDFDRLSQQMHAELQSTREKREKSASMYDLSGFTRPASGHPRLDELQQRRHAHMQELEREIERSAKSRQERMSSVPRQMEATPPRTHEIPIELEPRSRRAESLCNLNEPPPRPHTTVGHYNHPVVQDDWSRYANDLGYSENIARPFAREVEICYQRQNQRTPHCIRAPRLSASTNDLSSSSQYSYDTFNAYGGRRTHAPMLNQAQQQQRPHYGSCYSMIERDPNPRYISTTSRRGVSPAPPPVATPQQQQVPPPAYDRQQRRSSLPRELHEQQLKYILSKEEELKFEVERLQQERRRLMEEMQRAPVLPAPQRRESYRPAAKLPTLSEDEVFRQQMAEEWMNKVAEREERRQHKIIRISKIEDEHDHSAVDKATISDEFLDRVKERRHKLSMPADSDWESGAESQPQPAAQSQPESDVEAPPVRILEGQAEANLRQLPRHLREFAKFSTSEQLPDGAQMERHEEQERREEATDNAHSSATKKTSIVKTYKVSRLPPSVQGEFPGQFSGGNRGRLYRERSQTARLVSHNIPLELTSNHSSSPDSDFNPGCGSSPAPGSSTQSSIPSLVQSPTPAPPPPIEPLNPSSSTAGGILGTALLLGLSLLTAWNKFIYKVKHEYMSEPETGSDRPRKMAQLGRRQYDGIGPVTNDGMPIILRSEVKEPHQHEWYKRLYQTIHKQKNGDDFVIRYKCPRARPSYKSNGYVSEPEPNYDSDYSTVRYRTQNPHRVQSVSSAVNVRNLNQDEKLYGTMPNPIKSAQNSYKNQPGRIENYTTGHSSVSEKEKKEWWDEVMDIFNGNLEQSKLSPLYTEGNLSRALAKESGYTSDSNLVFRKKEVPVSSPLSPVEQKQAYKSLQAGGEPPLLGFRKPAPEKPRDLDPNAPPIPPQPPVKGLSSYDFPYSTDTVDGSDVNIHFKTPIRHEQRQNLSEEELAIRQAEHMQKLYHEERRRKYLQELQDMNSRRHTDNFTPSQKSPIALNRYDDFPTDVTLKSLVGPKTVARALFNFQGQTSKELSFRKGDTIYIRRQIDANWYEGEHNAMIGLLPASYVEIVSRDGARTPSKRPSEGQARAKYNFQAQSGIELSLNKGELVTLTRRVDGNWFEGKIANRKGIFPCSYVEVLTDIGAEDIAARTTTVITSQSTTNLRPNLDVLRTNINNEFNTLTQNGAQPPNGILKETRTLHKTDALHVDTSSEPLAYRALYKYRPQNSDELELLEGDVVHVLEKCDDGWFVGTSQRTGCFGTFPGNYVERA